MIKQLNPREKKLFYFALAFIISLVLYFFIILPMYNRISMLRESIRIQSIHLAKYTRILKNESQIQNAYQSYLNVLKVGANPQEEISKFLKEVDEICNASEVHIVDMKPLPSKQAEVFKKMRLEIEITAQQLSLGKFLFALKTSSTIIQIDSLNISAGSFNEGLKCRFVLSRIIA